MEASTTITTPPLQDTPLGPRTQSGVQDAVFNPEASRGNQRGGSFQHNPRGRGRGRGNRGNRESFQHQRRQQPVQPHLRPAPPRPPPDDLGGGGVSGDSPARDTANKEGQRGAVDKGKSAIADDGDIEVCFICASPVVHNSVAPCNHRSCHICALRLRALYKTRACAHCRTEAKYIIFTDDANKRYEDFAEDEFQKTDDMLGIKYTEREIYDDTVLLLRYNCPDHDCDIACYGWPDLHRHVKSIHQKVMCDLCTRNKKVFTHEHELFAPQELRKHEKFGDDHPGAVDQSGFKGHPECGFCRQRFYGDDELYTHCRDKHERCHICDRRSQGKQQQYYVDYDSLEQHFRSDHFLCADQECMDKKFVVFESEMDLKAHQLDVHPNGLTKDARRDARRVDISGFDYRAPHQEPRRGRGDREGRGRGRGRDPNTEPLPQSTAQPMRRDELAYQRQMAIQSAQSSTARTFGGQLTSTDAYAARPTSRGQDTITAPRGHTNTNPSFPDMDNLNLNLNLDPNPTPADPSTSPIPAQAQTPQQQARQLQHAAIIERASNLLQQHPVKIASFRDAVSAYRSSKLTASQLLDRFFTLFSVPSSDLGILIKELASIYENEEKRFSLLKAWNDWRAINEDYPSLPGPSGILPGASAAGAGSGGHRVLKLKSSTAQSSRSEVSKHGSWSTGASSSANPFPAISNTGSIARLGTTTPWLSGGNSSSSSARPSPAPSRPASRAPVGDFQAPPTDAFPALPVAKKPNTMIFGLTRGSVKWDDGRGGSTAVNPWAGGGSGNQAPAANDGALEDEADGSMGAVVGKKKGKQGKKEVLYKFG